MSHKELELLVVDMARSHQIVTDVYERYVVYESYNKFLKKEDPLNLKLIQSSLKLSFPKVKKIVNSLVENKYLIPVQSTKDKRVVDLLPSEKLKKGVELFEIMKMNELFELGFSPNVDNEMPTLSELSSDSVDTIQNKFLKEFLD
tara:strand:- start:451 stop:885 length:435 start_codon:yes stop_codon:yes gene_type:complete